ncbi:GatB/YqeY domain-containing protein [Thermosyntropha sp.]|uniref:GatB/YqeY domain-containing protein n=1 Tax=Thermosyntropha sp. TaxID=2740820 RepID=UPI0025F96EE6|nr:GatB/YqeY domain-containing protein [Thermosyntropha sp.]MBO8159144.1 GatB/YqeY domain-containing protein [Thermosyntropha sp.]
MSLNERLLNDMKEAMKAKEAGKIRLSTIRMVRAAQKELEIEKKRQLTDEELIQLIRREVKRRQDVIADYERANRPEMVEQLNEEIRVLEEYLPEQLGEDELRALVKKAIQETEANSLKDMGKVMKVLMPKIQGRADGKTVNEMVKEMLA